MKLAQLHSQQKAEPIWHVQLALMVAIIMQFSLSSELTVGPKYIIAGFELLLLFVLTVITPKVHGRTLHIRRALAFILIGLVTLSNIISLGLVIHTLFNHSVTNGKELIFSGVLIYLTNIILFGLWYWEMDGSGPGAEDDSSDTQDFLFPQTSVGPKNWQPTFFDYLYVSVTNATAFSPTDTMPLTHRAKLLMSLQSFVSLTTVGLVAARAVNILS